jgi:hypothetical protein
MGCVYWVAHGSAHFHDLALGVAQWAMPATDCFYVFLFFIKTSILCLSIEYKPQKICVFCLLGGCECGTNNQGSNIIHVHYFTLFLQGWKGNSDTQTRMEKLLLYINRDVFCYRILFSIYFCVVCVNLLGTYTMILILF